MGSVESLLRSRLSFLMLDPRHPAATLLRGGGSRGSGRKATVQAVLGQLAKSSMDRMLLQPCCSRKGILSRGDSQLILRNILFWPEGIQSQLPPFGQIFPVCFTTWAAWIEKWLRITKKTCGRHGRMQSGRISVAPTWRHGELITYT